jgi:hypothetical protein
MTKRSGPKNLKPIPAELVAQWGEDFPIQDAVRGKRWRWVCRAVRAGKPCGYSWTGSIISRMYRQTGCKLCAYAGQSLPLPDLLRVQWQEPDLDIDQVRRSGKTRYLWACERNHLWRAPLSRRMLGFGCPSCGRCRGADKRKSVEIPSWVRADWSAEFPIEEALRRVRYRFTHRGDCHRGKAPCGRKWETTLNSRLGANKTGCPFHKTGRPPISDERRRQIADMILAGHSGNAIARELHVAPSTISNLRKVGKLPERLNKRAGLPAAAACG